MVFPGVTARFSSPRLNMLPSILLGALDVSNESFESRSGGRGSRERCMYVCKAYEDRGYASGVRCARDLGIAGSRGFRENETCPRAFRIPGSPRFGTFEVWAIGLKVWITCLHACKENCAADEKEKRCHQRAHQRARGHSNTSTVAPRLAPCTRRRRAPFRRTRRSRRGA